MSFSPTTAKPETRPAHNRSKSDSLLYSKPTTDTTKNMTETSTKTQIYGEVPILILTKAEIPRGRRARNNFPQREAMKAQTKSMVLMHEKCKIVCGLPCDSSRKERELTYTLQKLTGEPKAWLGIFGNVVNQLWIVCISSIRYFVDRKLCIYMFMTISELHYLSEWIFPSSWCCEAEPWRKMRRRPRQGLSDPSVRLLRFCRRISSSYW